MNLRFYIALLFLSVDVTALAQPDTSNILTYDTYMDMVMEHHPVAIQAGLQPQKGEAYLMKSKGAFDPKVFTDISQKYFEGTEYYSHVNGGLKVPTWFGIELAAAYKENRGSYLNPEFTTPDDGLWYAGISIPLGRGLFIDQRRADLQQAKIYLESTSAQQQAIINELLYQAGAAYWEWFRSHSDVLVYENALALAEQRYDAVHRSAILGDRPSMDTVEAGIQVQTRRLGLQEAQLEYANATATISVFLWAEGQIPLELDASAEPPDPWELDPTPVDEALVIQIDTLIANHPELRTYELKIDGLEVDRRMKREQLKPQLDLRYNAINEPVGGNPLQQYSINNYNWGLEFNMPIFLRKERGDLELTNVKIREAEMDLIGKNANLHLKARVAINEWRTTVDQVILYRQTVRDYDRLVKGEQQLFNGGESSLFLVNRRELGYINAQIKRNALIAKNKKAALGAQYAFGLLGN